jgi:hypothetical protein
MKPKISIIIGLFGLALVCVPLAGGQKKASDSPSFNTITTKEIETLLLDVAKTNPMILRQMAADKEMKKKQLENLRQLLAFATQAQRDGLADDPINRQELENIRAEIIAVSYDREINKGKTGPAFSSIADQQLAAYWAADTPGRARSHQVEFDDFLKTKIALLKPGAQGDRQITKEEESQARDIFAKTRIYQAEFDAKARAGALSKDLVDRTNLQVKLQQAQFLARIYAAKTADQISVSDAEIAGYIAAHPELDPKPKRAIAESILERVKKGEDFAALANQFSQDPGNVGPEGTPQGGLYRRVPKGRMVPPFEQAALALAPGEVASELVESDFGYHIIKLERKGMSDANANTSSQPSFTYDVRHILISTSYQDPSDPAASAKPLKEYVRGKIETDKENIFMDKIVAENHIQVPTDFDVPNLPAAEPAGTVKKKTTVRNKRQVKKRK